MTTPRQPRYRGIFPVAPTTFTDSGELDLDSQKRCIDFMMDAGSALMGIGTGVGDNRAQMAARGAISSPLLEVSIDGARGVLGGADPEHVPGFQVRDREGVEGCRDTAMRCARDICCGGDQHRFFDVSCA